MARWGEWMVPELSLAAEAQLASARHTLLRDVHTHPDEVAQLALLTMQQNAMLESIMRKATARIAELELEALLRPAASSPAHDDLRSNSASS